MAKSKYQLSQSEIYRYSRHLTLPGFGIEAQIKLLESSVLVIGAGGLGSPLLLYLAAAGVGRLGIVDYDNVDETNLQRQIIHDVSWLNRPKVESAKNKLNQINPNLTVEVFNLRIDSGNALELIKNFDIVCDGTDNFKSRYLINDACYLTSKPYIYGSILQFEGQASVFNLTSNSPNYRDLVPSPPPPGLVPSCSEAGVIGVLPGIIGTIQATETIKILTGIGKTLDGRLLVYDALDMKFRELLIKKDKEQKPITKLIDYDDFCKIIKDNSQSTDEITASELNILINKDNRILTLDVRTNDERSICKIDQSIHIPLDKLNEKANIKRLRDNIPGRKLIIYCKAGYRSKRAVDILAKHNINSASLAGGIISWIKEVDRSLTLY